MSRLGNIVKIIIIPALLIVIGLSLNEVYQSNQVTTAKESRKTPRLNIALVNEDSGTTMNGKPINLGQAYASQVEKDMANDWYVVSDGIAQSGLRNGDYQLVIAIPNNFSAKLLEINSVKPETTNVTYAVEGSANVNVRATAERIGKDVVSKLNKQLVNIYFASVLDNLYTAQNNVSRVVTNDGNNVTTFNTSLSTPVQDIQSAFPVLAAGGESAKQTNQTLQQALDTLQESSNSVYDNATDNGQSFAKLMTAHATGQLTTADFYKALETMNPEILGSQVDMAMKAMTTSRDNLQLALKGTGSEAVGEVPPANLNNSLTAMNGGLTLVEATTKNNYDETLALIQQIADLQQNYGQKVASELGLKDTDDITMAQLLDYKTSEDTNQNNAVVSDIVAGISKRNEARVESLQKEIDTLPFNASDDALLGKLITQAQQDKDNGIDDFTLPQLESLQQQIDKVKTAVQDYNDQVTDETLKLKFQSDAATQPDSEATKLRDSIQQVLKAYQDDQSTAPGSDKVKFDDQVKSSLDSLKANVQSVIDKFNALSASYNELRGAVSAQQSSESTTTSSSIDLSSYPESSADTDGPVSVTPPTLSGDNATKFKQGAFGAYEFTLGQTALMYKDVLDDVTAFKSNDVNDQDLPASVSGILKISVKDYLNRLGSQVILASLGLDTAAIPNGDKTFTPNDLLKQIQENKDADQLTTLFNDLMTQYGNVTQQADDVDKQVSAQAEHLIQLQTLFQTVLDAQAKADSNDKDFDQQIQAQSQSFNNFLTASQALKQQSSQQSTDAKTTSAAMEAFAKQVADATNDGQKLNGTVKDLSNTLTNTLNNNQNFAKTFSGVLNNAHKNGVKNEDLISFLSNPVNSSLAVAEQKNKFTVNPFGWVFILYVTSFVLIYLLTHAKWSAKRVDSLIHDSGWIKTNVVEATIAFGLSVMLGAGFALISSRQLISERSELPLYFGTAILAAIFFGAVNRYLLRQFNLLGLAVTQLFSVSFIFIALVGTGMSLPSNLVMALDMLNPLSMVNRTFASVLSHDAVGNELMKLGVLAGVVYVVNAFVYHRQQPVNWSGLKDRLVGRKWGRHED